MATRTSYMVVETTDLRTRAKSFKVYERNAKQPTMVGLATREEAEAHARRLEEQREAR